MKRSASVVPLALLVLSLVTTTADARMPGHGHGGWHGRPPFHAPPPGHRGSFFVFGGPTFWDPFYYPYYYPYYYSYPPYPYYVPYPAYMYPPPPEEPGWSAPPAESSPPVEPTPETTDEALGASYGLVQLRGVPDGATIELDGRFWLTAAQLDARWLAVPKGEHRLTMRVRDGEPTERRINIAPGKSQVVRFDRATPPPA